jgi:RNA polymerase sigma-70 factor (ECF subfamily)
MTAIALPWAASPRPFVTERPADERDLVIAAQRGVREAFSELVRRHQRRAYVVARSIVVNHEDAEDAVQEAFLHAFKAIDRFLPDQAFGAWLHRIVANAALDVTRRRKVRDADELPETVASPFRDPAESSELRTRLKDALETLPARQLGDRAPRRRRIQTFGDRGGADIPEGTARSDLHYARSHLRRILGEVRSGL